MFGNTNPMSLASLAQLLMAHIDYCIGLLPVPYYITNISVVIYSSTILPDVNVLQYGNQCIYWLYDTTEWTLKTPDYRATRQTKQSSFF